MKKRTKHHIEVLESRIKSLESANKELTARLSQIDDVLFAVKCEIKEHVLAQRDLRSQRKSVKLLME